jgi:CheY-like chemotaxis protein/two-component sensor histidine kinase
MVKSPEPPCSGEPLNVDRLNRLMAGIAHDFRNLLTLINGISDVLMANAELPADVREDIGRIRRAGEQALAMTAQLLSAGKQQARVRLDWNDAIQDSLGLIERLLGPEIELVAALGAEEACVQADPGQIHQVLLNLVVNAKEAIAGSGRVTIEMEIEDQYAVLSVSDTGEGMDQETIERMFEPFFTTKGEASGRGLGLATVQDIVTRNGGWLTVWSEPGKGTRIQAHLPRAARQEPGSILVVDDDPGIRQLLHQLLGRAGYTVAIAENGRQAIEQVKAQPVDLVITDLYMPEREGLETIRELVAARPGLPIIAISGEGRDLLPVAKLLGAHATVAKPFRAEDLLRAVRETLGRSRPATGG